MTLWFLRRQAVPLAIALLFVSNPDVQALDALSRLSHDANLDVAQNAVLALGVNLVSQLLAVLVHAMQKLAMSRCTLRSSCHCSHG